jgi:transcriptional regulator with XRE-family HTH domain
VAVGAIGREVRRVRTERGWSQAQLAEAADMSVPGISLIETGARSPSGVSLGKIADALDVEVGELFPKARRRSSTGLQATR